MVEIHFFHPTFKDLLSLENLLLIILILIMSKLNLFIVFYCQTMTLLDSVLFLFDHF